ncbi:hypothetical protein EIN_020720 [Entamoeba invadens IP1]|uniref:hypothetical protein n=1 Tax=Entamoeba invadens IP1 TaxID=370355 RepID=UPI0002C3DCF3|nr:hypothetical protein EIN_020720 [Entamoeba invadens IP1]ELP90593.1 hypothetical protein EIN_020720 [Entamoeba invadens IP1]|eukprot:XP_004257364.1 hypothetical protein EIN_020720 [Entamoeba invadens IP1]
MSREYQSHKVMTEDYPSDFESHRGLVSEFNKIWAEQEMKWKELFDNRPMTTTGNFKYWHEKEHIRFLVCIQYLNATKCGGLPVQQIAAYIGTRNSIQVRTHAQKYFKSSKATSTQVQEKVKCILDRDVLYLASLFASAKKKKTNL